MKTDHPIYLFLSAGPEAFRILTGGLRLQGGYRFCSLTIKTLERRLDGILEPDGHEGPVYAIEFMGQPAPGAWYNLLTKIGLYGEQYPEREVTGILIYLRERDRPACPIFERFRGLTAKEIWAMLNLVTPIQETMAYRSIFAEGKTEGEAEGEAKGKAKGKAETLKRLLTRRFDALPDWALRRIESAPVAQLDLWLDGIFDAGSAEDLIGPQGGK